MEFESALDLRRGEESTHHTESQLRLVCASAPVGMFITDAAGRWTFANAACLKLLGAVDSADQLTPNCDDSEPLGRIDWLERVHPSDRAAVRRQWRGFLSQKVTRFSDEFRFQHLDGMVVWVQVDVARLPGKGTVPTACIGTAVVTSDHKETEQFLEVENELLEAVARGLTLDETLLRLVRFIETQSDDMLASVLLVDPDGSRLLHGAAPSLAPAYNKQVHGIPIGEGVGSCGTAAFRGEPVFVADIESDPLWDVGRELARRYGLRACWSTPLKDRLGSVLGTFAVYRTTPGGPSARHQRIMGVATHLASIVLARHHDDRKLVQSEQRLRSMFEHVAVGVAQLDSQSGMILHTNRRYCEILGVEAEDLKGKTWVEITHPADLDADQAQMDRLLRGEIREFTLEKRLRRGDGSFVLVSLTVSAMWPPGSKPTTHSAILEDITQRKRAEQERGQHRDALAHTTRLNTMGELVAGITHEVRQPLYAITNFATATSLSLSNAEAEQRLDQAWLNDLVEFNDGIRRASQRANAIIQRLRGFARKSEQTRELIDLNEVVQDSINLVAFEARQCEAVVQADLEPDLPGVFADRIQCEQVLVNLLHNAHEALAKVDTPRTVIIRSRLRDGDVVVEVEDTGPGIPTNQQARIFEAFCTTKPRGMGVGLAISRTIVEDHGGRLSVLAGSQCGATFVVSLPVAKPNPEPF